MPQGVVTYSRTMNELTTGRRKQHAVKLRRQTSKKLKFSREFRKAQSKMLTKT